MTNRNKQAGSQFERDIVNQLKGMGYDVVTSRAESRNMDNKKVDVFSPLGIDADKVFPYYIQAKFTAVNPAYTKLLDTMPNDRPGLIFHKKSEAYKCKDDNTRHRNVGEFVIMSKEIFYNLLNDSKNNKTLKSQGAF